MDEQFLAGPDLNDEQNTDRWISITKKLYDEFEKQGGSSKDRIIDADAMRNIMLTGIF